MCSGNLFFFLFFKSQTETKNRNFFLSMSFFWHNELTRSFEKELWKKMIIFKWNISQSNVRISKFNKNKYKKYFTFSFFLIFSFPWLNIAGHFARFNQPMKKFISCWIRTGKFYSSFLFSVFRVRFCNQALNSNWIGIFNGVVE